MANLKYVNQTTVFFILSVDFIIPLEFAWFKVELFLLPSLNQGKCSSTDDPNFYAYCNNDVTVLTPGYSVCNLDCSVELVDILVDFCSSNSR